MYKKELQKKRNFIKSCGNGFTFVETLLVISLLSVVSIALFHTFINGMRIWERGYKSFPEEDVMIAFEKITQDLRNTLDYSLIKFHGDPDSISFATIVRSKIDARKTSSGDYFVNEIGKVQYVFDKDKRELYRKQANYSQALENKFGAESLLAKNIYSVKFHYYYRRRDGYIMKKGTREGSMPVMVSVDISFFEGRRTRTMTKLIPIAIWDS